MVIGHVIIFKYLNTRYINEDRAERHDFWSRFWLFILLFLFPPGRKRKGKKENQSRGQKSCLSARSLMKRGSFIFWTPYIYNIVLSFCMQFFRVQYFSVRAIPFQRIYCSALSKKIYSVPLWLHFLLFLHFSKKCARVYRLSTLLVILFFLNFV